MRFGISATSSILPKNLRTRLRPVNVCAIVASSIPPATRTGGGRLRRTSLVQPGTGNNPAEGINPAFLGPILPTPTHEEQGRSDSPRFVRSSMLGLIKTHIGIRSSITKVGRPPRPPSACFPLPAVLQGGQGRRRARAYFAPAARRPLAQLSSRGCLRVEILTRLLLEFHLGACLLQLGLDLLGLFL